MIMGRDLLEELGIIIDFHNRKLAWDGEEIEMPGQENISCIIPRRTHEEPTSVQGLTSRAARILDAKYEATNSRRIVKGCTHLDSEKKYALQSLLEKYEKLFDGTLGTFDTCPASLEVKEGSKPVNIRPYSIPVSSREVFKKELDRLVKAGVLKKETDSAWASPSFLMPKKDGSVRFLTDFRQVNQRLVRKPYPLPKILDIMQTLEGFTYATTLDLNMGYYTIKLDSDAQKVCTIVTPYGKYSYQRLPMGVMAAPDIFQSKMSDLIDGLEYVRV